VLRISEALLKYTTNEGFAEDINVEINAILKDLTPARATRLSFLIHSKLSTAQMQISTNQILDEEVAHFGLTSIFFSLSPQAIRDHYSLTRYKINYPHNQPCQRTKTPTAP
jgi:hypothetical protein